MTRTPPRRIHVVGCAPRSGTTLLTEMMVNSFEVDGFAPHEMSVLARPAEDVRLLVTKTPRDVLLVGPLLRIDGGLWVVHVLRDPRDVVVSRHAKDPSRYWANLRMWREYQRAAAGIRGHPRFTTVRYEDLVRGPSRVQAALTARMPFLVRRADFADFHRAARPSAATVEALGGLRPVDASSVGAWRREKPRLAAQLALHGPVTQELIDLGYEADDAWLAELRGVTPANGESRWPERTTPGRRARQAMGRMLGVARYAVGARPRVALGRDA